MKLGGFALLLQRGWRKRAILHIGSQRGVSAAVCSRRSIMGRLVWQVLVLSLIGFVVSGAASAQGVGSREAAAARGPALIILSTVPEGFARARVRAFERQNPGARIELLTVRPEQVLSALRSATPAQRAHLIWSASVESFGPAAAEGLLLGSDGEPRPLGGTATVDQRIAVPVQHLMRVALVRRAGAASPAWPERWQDLAEWGDCGARLVNPFAAPGGVGSLLLEAVLQDLGWQAGWSQLSALVAASASAANGGPQLSFVYEEAALDDGLEMRPAFAAISRSRLALVASGSRDLRLAQRFVRFLGAEPSGPSAAVPSVSAPARASASIVAQYISLDLALLERREPVMGVLSRQWLVAHAPNLKQACLALLQAARRPADDAARRAIDEARGRAFGPALPERSLTEDAVTQAFSPQVRDVLRRPRVAALESQWAALALERHAQAMNLLAPGGR